jgi:Mlc titration factor MtfA (ptsG expression regulator)
MWEWLNRARRPVSVPPTLWNRALARLPYTMAMPDTDRERLRDLVLWFLRTKTFEGAAGLAVTDRMRVEIALQACLLILNLDRDYYSGWRAIILYPGDFVVPRETMDEAGVVHRWDAELAGESWERGPVILSWEATADPEADMSIVLHEFAHKIDMRDGVANGCPPLPAALSTADWQHDFQQAYDAFCAALDRNQQVRVDEYAAESPAEFFAVLSELFFLRPDVVADDFPAPYRQLCSFYRQDPLRVLGAA